MELLKVIPSAEAILGKHSASSCLSRAFGAWKLHSPRSRTQFSPY